jgi:uncharacterized protein (DUF1810 family)
LNDPFNLRRFLWAQEGTIESAMTELRAGCKSSHWMWFVFPQVQGLGRSATAQEFAIGSAAEAQALLDHPVLGKRLETCCELLLTWRDSPAAEILGSVDALKLRSSMTLFHAVSEKKVFQDVLDAFYGGVPDAATTDIIAGWQQD